MKNKKVIFISILIFFYVINKSSYYNLFNKVVTNETVKLINLNFTKEDYKIKGINFLNKCKEFKLNKSNLIENKKTKISVIIPIYNCQDSINLTINSIILQNFKDIELILVNDLSQDNSSQIINGYQNFDRRIKIINNKKNMGTLYSRCIGVLKSKGEYIIGLDNDDLFSNEKILETVYLNAKVNDFDIVEIKSLRIPNYNPMYKQMINGLYISHGNNLILHQPELGLFSIVYKGKFFFRDHYAWGKCVKSKIYKKAVIKIGKKRYSLYNCWTEDMSIVFVLFNIAKSFIFLNMFGILKYRGNSTTTHKLSPHHKFLSSIFFLDILFDFSKNDYYSKKYIAQYALGFSLEKINLVDYKNKLYFFSIIKKLIECKYISENYKYLLKQKFHY